MSVEDVASRLPGALAQRGDERATLDLPSAEILGESGLTQRSQRLSTTLDHAGVGIAEIDPEGRLLRVNNHLCELIGCGADDLLGRSIFDETYADDAETDRARFRRQVAGEIDCYTIEKRIRRKDGSCFWASISSSSVRDPAGHFLAGCARRRHTRPVDRGRGGRAGLPDQRQRDIPGLPGADPALAGGEFADRTRPRRDRRILQGFRIPAFDRGTGDRRLRCVAAVR